MAVVQPGDYLQYQWLRQIAFQCQKFILAIPDKTITDKLFDSHMGYGSGYNYDAALQYWRDIRWIDQVVTITETELSYQAAYEKYGFDMCVYGSCYGQQFELDRAFMESKGVDFVSIIPDNLAQISGNTAIKLFLRKNKVRKKIVLFGTGKYFDYYMEHYGDEFVPAYAVDNDQLKWETQKDGIEIKNPAFLRNEKDIAVIICARKYKELVEQLKSYGILEYRLLLYRNEVALLEDYNLYRSELDLSWETLDRIQEINYDMLEDFDRICRKYSIEYSLNYGSLIGALRHKGFIPWDNDIDTIMTRDNCDRLKTYKNEFDSDKYFWLEPYELGKKKYFDCITRLGYRDAYVRQGDDFCTYYENLYNGIHLDLFLIDKTYDNWRGRFQRFELAILYGLMNAYRHPNFFADYPPELMKKNRILCAVGKHISLQWMQRKADKVARRFNKKKDAPYYFISNDSLRMLGILFPAEDFEHVVDAPFGRVNSMVYSGADHICRMNFGDYMQLPPEEARVPHIGRVMLTSDQFVFLRPKRNI